jgi:tRNA-specific 2-thiouridylase
MNLNKKTVFVGVSGGVDSAVSAALLKDQGYNVIGVFIRTWTPDFIECTWRDERRDAMRVCAHLEIPFLECDAEDEYKKGVADYMIEEYKKGNTPNPDVMCNREVKFGVFLNFAKERGADFIATGHYARNKRASRKLKVESYKVKNLKKIYELDEPYELLTGCDSTKDQVYFLWTLTQDDLAHTLFPIGHLNKIEVRKLAIKYKIPNAKKKDSQGVCFLGPLDMKDFLKHYIETKKGDVLDIEGKIIGSHDGAVFFTLGERHGFTIFKHSEKDKPLYIIVKDLEKNTVTVSTKNNLPLPTLPLLKGGQGWGLNMVNTNWISRIPEKDKIYTAQIRYHGELLNCQISRSFGSPTSKNMEIIFDKEVLVNKGQSIVIYDSDICLGGGVVE